MYYVDDLCKDVYIPEMVSDGQYSLSNAVFVVPYSIYVFLRTIGTPITR